MFRRLWQSSRGGTDDARKILDPYEAYQLWAPNYDTTVGSAVLFAEAGAVHPIVQAHDLAGSTVLDAGCGTGRNLPLLRHSDPRLVVGTDFSPNRGKPVTFGTDRMVPWLT